MAQELESKVDGDENSFTSENMTWQESVGLSMKTPIGLFGICLTTKINELVKGGQA